MWSQFKCLPHLSLKLHLHDLIILSEAGTDKTRVDWPITQYKLMLRAP